MWIFKTKYYTWIHWTNIRLNQILKSTPKMEKVDLHGNICPNNTVYFYPMWPTTCCPLQSLYIPNGCQVYLFKWWLNGRSLSWEAPWFWVLRSTVAYNLLHTKMFCWNQSLGPLLRWLDVSEDSIKYRRLIGSLIHLTYPRPDLLYNVKVQSVCKCTMPSSFASSHLCSLVLSMHKWLWPFIQRHWVYSLLGYWLARRCWHKTVYIWLLLFTRLRFWFLRRQETKFPF